MEKMIHCIIDGEEISVAEGTTILEAARQLNVHIPTLCYHEDQAVKAVCRICVVEVEGQKLLPAACSTPVTEGVVVKTASPKVIKARKNVMELILARHPQDCLICSENGRCELQKVAQDLNMNRKSRYDLDIRDARLDGSSPSIFRDMSKCILCSRCVDTSCVNCGQCAQVCPVGAISIRDDTDKLYGEIARGKIVHALRKIGFHKVFNSDFSADLTIMEEGTEFLDRLKNGGVFPMMTSCRPAWVKYCETYGYEQLGHLSSAKSPSRCLGQSSRRFSAKKKGSSRKTSAACR